MKGLGIVTAIATVAVKGVEAIIGAITRPRMAEDWAGAGEYEERFLREMFFAFPPEKHALINQDEPMLIELYDFLVSYGKAQYPNKRGMVGAGADMSEVTKQYVQNFIRDAGGASNFAFLFRDLEKEAICQQKKEAVLAKIKQFERAKFTKKALTIAIPVGIGVAGWGAWWAYRRYQNKQKAQSTKPQKT